MSAYFSPDVSGSLKDSCSWKLTSTMRLYRLQLLFLLSDWSASVFSPANGTTCVLCFLFNQNIRKYLLTEAREKNRPEFLQGWQTAVTKVSLTQLEL